MYAEGPGRERLIKALERRLADKDTCSALVADYELLVVLPRSGLQRAASVLEPAGVPLAEIGRITAGRGVRLRLPGGRSLPMTGHDQLRS